MKPCVLLILLLLLLGANIDGQSPPAGWRFPGKEDFHGDWSRNRKNVPSPYHFQADLNGDGVADDVWIMIPTRGKGQALFVFLSQKSAKPRALRLDSAKDSPPQSMYISLAKPDTYKTACGKGYWKCKTGEPDVLRLSRPGIVYAMYESASSIFYWDTKAQKFIRVWISD